MIEDAKQLAVTKARLREFEGHLRLMTELGVIGDDLLAGGQRRAMASQIETFKEEIAEYEDRSADFSDAVDDLFHAIVEPYDGWLRILDDYDDAITLDRYLARDLGEMLLRYAQTGKIGGFHQNCSPLSAIVDGKVDTSLFVAPIDDRPIIYEIDTPAEQIPPHQYE